MGIKFEDTKVPLKLSDKDQNGLQQNYYQAAEFKNEPIFTGEAKQVGESIMAAPDSKYALKVNLEQSNVAGGTKPYVTEQDLIVPGDNKTFEAGHQYTIRIAIYGLQEAKIQIVPEGWIKNDDDINVDEDAI